MTRPHFLIAAAITMLAASAAAEEIAPGVVASENAISIGRGFPLWIEVDGGYIAKNSGEAHCYNADHSQARTSMGAERWRNQRIAVDRNTEQIYVVSVQWQDFAVNAPVVSGIQIARTDCGTTFDILHESFEGDDVAWDMDYAWRDNSGVFQQALMPMAPGGTLFLPAADGVYTWSVATPQNPPAPFLQYADLSAAVLAAIDDPWGTGRREAPAEVAWRMRSAVGLDGGGLLATLDDSTMRAYTFSVDSNGRPTLLTHFPDVTVGWALPGPQQIPASSSYVSEFDAVIGFAAGGISFIPLQRPELLATYPQPLIPQTVADGGSVVALFTSGAGGRVFAVDDPPGAHVVRELSFDPLRLDVDGDGLRRHQEEALGTDDLRWDTDDDGYSDSAELWLYDTSPTSASDAPTLPTASKLGISNLLGDVRRDETSLYMTALKNLKEPYTTASYGYGYICPGSAGVGSLIPVCFDHQGTKTSPSFSFEGSGDIAPVASTDGSVLAFTDLALGQIVGFHNQPPNFYYSDGGNSVVRKATGNEFSIVDPTRANCPFAVNASDSRCTVDGFSYPGTRFAEVVGSQPLSQSVLVTLRSLQHTVIAAANTDRVEVLGDGRLWGPWRPEQIIPIDEGASFLVNAVTQTNAGPARRWWIADANLRPVHEFLTWSPSSFNPGSTPLGGTYREGIISMTGLQFAIPNAAFGAGGGACTTGGVGGGFTCGKPNTMQDPFVPSAIFTAAQLVPVSAGVGPGDVIFAGPVVGVSLGLPPDGGVLGRITESGAETPWLTYRDLRRLAGGEPASVAWDGLRFVDLAATSSPMRICLVEGFQSDETRDLAGRLWELELGSDGIPEAFRLVLEDSASPPAACGYDDSGVLHWLLANELVSSGGSTTTSIATPRHLERVGAHWVAIGDIDVSLESGAAIITTPHAEASCIDSSGAEQAIGDVLAVTSFGGLSYLLDSYGEVTVRRTGDVCDGQSGPWEHFLEPKPEPGSPDVANIWNEIREGVLAMNSGTNSDYVPWRVRFASLAMRPDGLLLAAPGGSTYGRGARPPRGLWRLKGAYYPEDPSNRLDELDELRRETPLMNLMSSAEQIEAMVVIPGADAWEEPAYEYLVIDRPAPRPALPGGERDAGADVGIGPDAGPPVAEDEKNCRCAVSARPTGSWPGWILVFALIWVSRIRKRR